MSAKRHVGPTQDHAHLFSLVSVPNQKLLHSCEIAKCERLSGSFKRVSTAPLEATALVCSRPKLRLQQSERNDALDIDGCKMRSSGAVNSALLCSLDAVRRLQTSRSCVAFPHSLCSARSALHSALPCTLLITLSLRRLTATLPTAPDRRPTPFAVHFNSASPCRALKRPPCSSRRMD